MPDLNDLIEKNDYGQRPRTEQDRCGYCLCASCTGFGCPWLKTKVLKNSTDGNKIMPERCFICMTENRFNVKEIHDCEKYTSYRRTRFFVAKRLLRPTTKLDEILEKLEEINNKIDKE